jgi:AcrR family transcriptional regulator
VGKGTLTRGSIVEEAIRSAQRDGLEGLSLGPLAERLGMSKSGLFAHFKAKETLQLAVLHEASRLFSERVVGPALARRRGPERLTALFHNYLDWMQAGCVFSVVAQEIDVLPGTVVDAFLAGQSEWRETIRRLAADVVDPSDLDAFVVEFVGLALAYQQAVKVFDDPKARRHVLRAFRRSLEIKG